MKLDVSNMRFINKDEWRVLTAVEMGMRNHEYVSPKLIESISNLRRTGIYQLLQNLLRNKLVSRESKKYEGYRLSHLGYDFLALRALNKRGVISSVGTRIGVGKESDIHIAADENGKLICLKLHRLGRISFRNVKNTRDYLRNRKTSSWLYLSRLAALKEFSCMKALYENGFGDGEIKVPEPIDWNRHAIVMELKDAVPLNSIKELKDPYDALEKLMRMIVLLANCGLIHGDFNEFNLLIDSDENITLIDFPQIVNTDHVNAEMYFNRDVNCIINLFKKRFGIEVTDYPKFEDIVNLNNKQNVINIRNIDKDMSKLDYLNNINQNKDLDNYLDIDKEKNYDDFNDQELFENEKYEDEIEDEDETKDEDEYESEEENINKKIDSDEQDSSLYSYTEESEIEYNNYSSDENNSEFEFEEDSDSLIDNSILPVDEYRANLINQRIKDLWLPKKKQINHSKIRRSIINEHKKHHNVTGNSGSKKSREYRKTKALIESAKYDY